MKNIFEKFRLVAGTLATVTLVAFSLQYSFSGYAYKNAENLHEEVWAQAMCAYFETLYNNLLQQVNINCIGGCSSNYTCMGLCNSMDAAYQAWQNCLNGNQGGGDPGGGGNSSTGTGEGGGSTVETLSCLVSLCNDETRFRCISSDSGNCGQADQTTCCRRWSQMDPITGQRTCLCTICEPDTFPDPCHYP